MAAATTGSKPIKTANIIFSVVSVSRTWGDGDTSNFRSSIVYPPSALVRLARDDLRFSKTDVVQQRPLGRADVSAATALDAVESPVFTGIVELLVHAVSFQFQRQQV